jgi:hypothetical protein
MSSTQIVYIPNLFGGQSIRIAQVDEEANILATSFESSGFALNEETMKSLNLSSRFVPSNPRRDSSDSISTTSSSYIPDDAF